MYTTDDIQDELQDLWALAFRALAASSGSGGANPLVRSRFVDGDTPIAVPIQNGSATSPFASIGQWLTSLPILASANDGRAFRVAEISPILAGAYVENPAFRGRRSQFLKGLAASPSNLGTGAQVTGNVTWANLPDASGFAPARVISGIVDLLLNGNFTETDDGLVVSLLYFSMTGGQQVVSGTIDTSGCTACSSITVSDASVGAINAGNIASSAIVKLLWGASVPGNITAKGIVAQGASLGGNVTTLAGQASSYQDTVFTGAGPTLTGGVHTMDPSTYKSFVEQVGVLAGGATISVLPTSDFLSDPQPVAAGAVVVMAHGDLNSHDMDLSAAQINVTLDPNPSGGQRYRAKNNGVGATPALIHAANGWAIEQYSNPGHYSAANGNSPFGGAGNGEAAEWFANVGRKVWELAFFS